MANPETKSQREIWGTRARNAGIIAGVIGLLAEASSIFVGGVGLAASGEIFRRLGKKPQSRAV